MAEAALTLYTHADLALINAPTADGRLIDDATSIETRRFPLPITYQRTPTHDVEIIGSMTGLFRRKMVGPKNGSVMVAHVQINPEKLAKDCGRLWLEADFADVVLTEGIPRRYERLLLTGARLGASPAWPQLGLVIANRQHAIVMAQTGYRPEEAQEGPKVTGEEVAGGITDPLTADEHEHHPNRGEPKLVESLPTSYVLAPAALLNELFAMSQQVMSKPDPDAWAFKIASRVELLRNDVLLTGEGPAEKVVEVVDPLQFLHDLGRQVGRLWVQADDAQRVYWRDDKPGRAKFNEGRCEAAREMLVSITQLLKRDGFEEGVGALDGGWAVGKKER